MSELIKFNKIRIPIILELLLLFIFFSACDSSDNNEPITEKLSFKVVDSLLGPVYEVETVGKSFRPPAGFKPIPDSLLKTFQDELVSVTKENQRVDLLQFFFDQAHQAGLIVSVIRDLQLTGDTAAFIGNYRSSLIEFYGESNVRTGDYWIDSIYVKNFLITDSVNVKFQLICLSSQGDALELQYFAPHIFYADLVRSFESSIGTIRLLKKGG